MSSDKNTNIEEQFAEEVSEVALMASLDVGKRAERLVLSRDSR